MTHIRGYGYRCIALLGAALTMGWFAVGWNTAFAQSQPPPPAPVLGPGGVPADPALGPNSVPNNPALAPDQTNPNPVLGPNAVPDDPALGPNAVPNSPALSPDQTNPAPVYAPDNSDSLGPLKPIFPDSNQ
jgi:hypothetical protein